MHVLPKPATTEHAVDEQVVAHGCNSVVVIARTSRNRIFERRDAHGHLSTSVREMLRTVGVLTTGTHVREKEGVMTELWVERTGARRYTGRSTRGAEVLVDGVGEPQRHVRARFCSPELRSAFRSR